MVGHKPHYALLSTVLFASSERVIEFITLVDVHYRARHPLYWINPYLENLYEQWGEDVPDDFEPMYFDSELECKATFLLMQSSMFYHYWMTYGNQRDVNWGPIEAFPFPDEDDLKDHEEEIEEIAKEMWTEMESH